MNWYKENIALQEELQREYPAVAEMIDQLEQQLSRYEKSFKQFGWEDCGGEYLKPPVQNTEVIQNLIQQLSSYASAVEVEGRISFAGAEKIIRIGNVNDHKDLVYLQRVKVLVMPKEVE